MPPKGITPNLFGERKIYIGTSELDLKPLDEITKDAITVTEKAPAPESINTTGTITFKFHCKVDPRWYEFFDAIDKLINAYKRRKPRKTTYKTLRHDCAKRNGRR